MASRPTIGPQSTVNERLVALEIVRQILLLRFSLRVRRMVVNAINDTEQPIARMIRDALRMEAGVRNASQVRKLDELIGQINAIRQPSWQAARQIADNELSELAQAEVEDQRDMFAYLLPGIATVDPSPFGMGGLAIGAAFLGRTLRKWFEDASADEAKRIRQAIYLGVAAGESPASVARRVVGTAKAKGRDGATQTSRNHIDTIIRSATVHVGATARDQFYKANGEVRYVPVEQWMPPRAAPGKPPKPPVRPVGGAEDPVAAEARRQAAAALAAADAAKGAGKGGTKVFAQEQFVAILDSRTTKLCRGLDGKRYRLGKGPIPPLHLNCRSNRVLVLPAKLGGPVYDPGKYGEWVRKQPEAVQVILMGSTKDHKLTDRELAEAGFQDYGARPMSLKQVRDEARRIMEYY